MPRKQHKNRRMRRGAVLLPALFCSLLLTGCGLGSLLSGLQGQLGAVQEGETPQPSEYVHFNLIGSETPEPGQTPRPSPDPAAVPVMTLEEALASDSWGLLYPHPRESFVGREYYDVSDEKELILSVSDGLARGIPGIVIRYSNHDCNYWLKVLEANVNRSELSGQTGGSFTVIDEGGGTMGVYPIYKQAAQAFTYYRFLEPEISGETMDLLRAAYDLAAEAVQKYPGDEYGILLYLNDRLAAMAEYAEPIPSGLGIPERDATGVFFKGRAVCAGYTAAYQLVLNILGIENKAVTNNKDSGSDAAHIWNYVKFGGQWYHVDVTWNRSDDPEYRDEYFLLTDEELAELNGGSSTHAWIPFLN